MFVLCTYILYVLARWAQHLHACAVIPDHAVVTDPSMLHMFGADPSRFAHVLHVFGATSEMS